MHIELLPHRTWPTARIGGAIDKGVAFSMSSCAVLGNCSNVNMFPAEQCKSTSKLVGHAHEQKECIRLSQRISMESISTVGWRCSTFCTWMLPLIQRCGDSREGLAHHRTQT